MKMICVRLPDDVAQEFKVEALKKSESAQRILGGSVYSYIGKEYPAPLGRKAPPAPLPEKKKAAPKKVTPMPKRKKATPKAVVLKKKAAPFKNHE